MKKQKALIVTNKFDDEQCLEKINGYLDNGWTVVNTCPMPSSILPQGFRASNGEFCPTCLVIIEKE